MQKKFVLDLKKSLHENAGSSSAKREEIFYKASRINSNIGSATVYRMVSVLEEIGAISRKNMLRVACSEDCSMEDVCTVVLDDNTTYHCQPENGTRWYRPGSGNAATWEKEKWLRSR